MAEFSLSAQKRDVIGKKVKQLRREGFVPGTIYGPATEPVSVQFKYRELELSLRDAGGTNLIDVSVDDDNNYPVLARDVQRDVIKGTILHVDFFAVDMNTKIRADIPLVYEGQSPLVISRKGIMITGPNSITVEMLPSRLINQVVVNVNELDEMGATISVADLPIDEGITVLNDPEEMIARIVQPSAARSLEKLEELAAAAEGEGEGEDEVEGEGEEV